MKTNDILSENISIVQPALQAQEPDHEVQMARSELYRAGKCAIGLHNMLKSASEQQGLEGWVQAKITKAADYLESVYHYLDYENKSSGLAEAGPVAPGSVPAGSVTTPGDNTPINGASPGTDQLNQQKAAAAVALQRKQIQDQIRATQKQLQDLQKQLQTIGSIASATAQPKVQESASAGASSAGGVASVAGTVGGKRKKEVGSLFGGTYKQNESSNVSEIKKGEKDANGYTKCWPGKHAEGTKKGKNGGQVRNCVPNESVAEVAVLDKHFGTVPGPDVEHDKQKIRSLLTQMMGKLPSRYERVLRMMYFQDMTVRQVADKLGVTTGRVRQIEAKALRYLKQPDQRPKNRALGGALDSYSDVHEAANAAQQAAIAVNMKKAGKKPKSEEELEESFLNSRFDMIEEMVEDFAAFHGVDSDLIWEDFELVEDDDLLYEAEAWQTKKGKNKNGGLNKKGVDSYRRSHPGSKLQTAVTTEPSKLKKGSKASKRRKSFCARMKGMKKSRTSAKTARDPDSRINKALRKWHCESNMNAAEKHEQGPKFTGYWKGTDKGKPGKKMVGSN